MSKKNYETLHFTIEGAWFTWFLRHLWTEGNETKAVNTWAAAFPSLASSKHLRGLFIDNEKKRQAVDCNLAT